MNRNRRIHGKKKRKDRKGSAKPECGMPFYGQENSPRARIKVVGAGSGGAAIVAHIATNLGLKDVEFMVTGTDEQALRNSPIERKVLLSATEDQDAIALEVEGTDMLFVVACMDDEDGADTLLRVARAARQAGVLTIGIVRVPASSEGTRRMEYAGKSLDALKGAADTLLVIPYSPLAHGDMFPVLQTTADGCFQAVQALCEPILIPGLINIDFADVRTILEKSGTAFFGVGTASGVHRAHNAALQAIGSHLLGCQLKKAKGVFMTIRGGTDVTIDEISDAVGIVQEAMRDDVCFFFSTVTDETLETFLNVSLIACFTAPAQLTANGHIVFAEENIENQAQEK